MPVEYASRLATRWLASGRPEPWRELTGTAVLADLSGFTRLTESLANSGPEGVEVLHRSLSLCFATLLEPSLALDGDIVGFAGDAALVWFDGDEHARRAVQAAGLMPVGLARLPAAITGGKRLRVSVGVHTGTVTAFMAGTGQRGLFLCGPDVTTLVGLQTSARPGQVLASPVLAGSLPAGWLGTEVDGAVEVTRRARGARRSATTPDVEPLPPPRGTADSRDGAGSLLSPAVRELVRDGAVSGEHRSVAIGFLSVAGTDGRLTRGGPASVHRVLEGVVDLVSEVAEDLSVSWLDTDVGRDGVKLLLAAGAPRATDDDEGRLLLAMRTIIDRAEVPLRGGAQRGRVYCGSLGVPGRRTFTAIGDATNVAARALGFADERDLVVGDGLGVADRPGVQSEPLGPSVLRNRVRPVELWRVGSVAPNVLGPADASPSGPKRQVTGSGRPAERERVATAWAGARGGRGSALCFIGDQGMGGSDLLADALDLAGARPTHVVCDPFRRQVPYGVLGAIVEAMALARGAPNGGVAGWLLSHADALEPGSAAWLDDARRAIEGVPRRDEPDPLAAGHRARVALIDLVAAAAPEPWLLAVDDIDAVDEASWLVLLGLVRRCERAPWLILMSSRPGGRVSAGDRQPSAIELEPLSGEEATAYVIECAPGLRDDQVARVVAAGHGNPLVLAELANHPDPGSLPDSLERLAMARVDRLPPRARRLVRDASAFGASFELEAVADVLGMPELADPSAWADARPIMRSTEPGTLAFRHDAYRFASHAALSFRRRRDLHSAIAHRLAARPGASGAVLAWHLEEAGRTREAFPLTVDAAAGARAAGALVEASDLLQRAVRMAREVDRGALGALLLEQGEVLLLLGDAAGAARTLTTAARIISDPRQYALLCSRRADVAIRLARFRQARAAARKGLEMAKVLADDTEGLRGRLLLDEAAALHFLGRNTESLRLATDALEIATAGADLELEGRAHLHLEMVHSVLNHPEAREHGESAIARFETTGNDRSLGDALSNSGLTAMLQGRWSDAREKYRRASAVLQRIGDSVHAATVDMNLGFLLLRQGEVGEADRLARRSLRVFETAQIWRSVAYAQHLRSRVAVAEARFADAATLMEDARATFVRLGERAMVVDCDVATMDRLLAEGRPRDAARLAAEIERDLVHGDAEASVMHRLLHGLAEVRLGGAERGVPLVQEALAAARAGFMPYEVYLCLDALIETEEGGGPPAPAAARTDRAAIAAELGLASAGSPPG